MVDLDRMHVYAWDARPYPAFPADTDAWGDGANWRLGHWLTGRIASAPLAARCAPSSPTTASPPTTPARSTACSAASSSTASCPRARRSSRWSSPSSSTRARAAAASSSPTAAPPSPPPSSTPTTSSSPPRRRARHPHPRAGDRPAGLRQDHLHRRRRRLSAPPWRKRAASPAAAAAWRWPTCPWRWMPSRPPRSPRCGCSRPGPPASARSSPCRRAAWRWSPATSSLSPPTAARACCASPRSASTACATSRRCGLDPDVYADAPGAARGQSGAVAVIVGQPFVVFLDLPLLRGDEPPAAGYVAAAQTPWPGPVAFYRSPETAGFQLKAHGARPRRHRRHARSAAARRHLAPRSRNEPCASGSTAARSPPSPSSPCSAAPTLAAVRNADGEWEVLQFLTAILTAPATYTLTGFLRGQAGTEHAMRAPLAAGARFVLLDGALARVDMTEDEVGLAFNWKCGPASRDIGSPNYVAGRPHLRRRGPEAAEPRARARDALGAATSPSPGSAAPAPAATPGTRRRAARRGRGALRDRHPRRRHRRAHPHRHSPGATYTAAHQTADFGTPQSSVSLRIFQISATRGRGTPARGTP